jgi:hypothetical protein
VCIRLKTLVKSSHVRTERAMVQVVPLAKRATDAVVSSDARSMRQVRKSLVGGRLNNIVRIRFGSHLYGTATPASDEDWKSVHVPDARSIMYLTHVVSCYSAQRKSPAPRSKYKKVCVTSLAT